MLNSQDWSRRFNVQSRWTEEIRRFIIQQVRLGDAGCLLEPGCGTGAIIRSMQHLLPLTRIFGIDLRLDFLKNARDADPQSLLAAADAARLPYPDGSFDAVFCHYFLLWVRDPAAVLAEMKRVTRPGGTVIAMAEPDYGGRIDYPAQLAELGRLQGQALHDQGADPNMGRKLNGLFHAANLSDVHTGLVGGQWNEPPTFDAWESEWAMLEADLGHIIAKDRLNALRSLDAAAWQKGERILFVPTFYAWGKV